jgi:phage FluMu protein Com
MGKANPAAASQCVRLLSKIPACKSVNKFRIVVKDGHLFLSFSSQIQY